MFASGIVYRFHAVVPRRFFTIESTDLRYLQTDQHTLALEPSMATLPEKS
jgi:hypothetical protein